MRRTRFLGRAGVMAALLVGELGVVSVRSRAWAAPAADEDLNNRGVEFRAAGRDNEAREVFQQAYNLTHSPRAAAQLGLAYQALGRWETAEPLVNEGLSAVKDPWINKYRKTLEDDLQLIQSHLAHIELTGEPPDAEVRVNGRPAGRLPMATPLAVTIGEVDIELRAPGYRTGVRRVTLSSRQYERVFVRLDKDAAATAAQTTGSAAGTGVAGANATASGSTDAAVGAVSASSGGSTQTDHPRVSTARLALKWTSLGLAVAGVGAGVAASIIHSQKVDDFQLAHGGDCSEKSGTAVDSKGQPVAECQSLLDAYHSARIWQVVGFIAGGVFAAGWLALQLTETSASGNSSGATAAWACAPTVRDVGAACVVRF